MLLRAATVLDVPGLVDVQEAGDRLALAHIFPQDTYPFPRAEIEARWVAEIGAPEVEVFVVERRAGRIEGFAALRADELLHFGVAAATWGSGLAAEVHAELAGRLVAAGHPSAWLRVFEDNRRARRFYEKAGWRPDGRTSRSAFAPYPLLVHYGIRLS